MKIRTKIVLMSIGFGIYLLLMQLIGILFGLDSKSISFGSVVSIWGFIIFDNIASLMIEKHYDALWDLDEDEFYYDFDECKVKTK